MISDFRESPPPWLPPSASLAGNCGQLGHGNTNDLSEFQRIAGLGVERAAYVACGEEFTIIVTMNRKVYACGLGSVGQMGDGKLESHDRPTHVPGLDDCGVEMVTCSQGQCLAITKDGDIFSWGLPGARG